MRDTINIPRLGELEIVEVYEYFNGPLFFACMNYASHLYIALYAQRLPEYEKWFFAEVSPMRLNLIRSGEISLHDAFSKPETKRLLQAMIPHSYSESVMPDPVYVNPDEIHAAEFPSTDKFLYFKDNPVFFHATDSLEIAKSFEREIIEVKFDSIEEYKSEVPIHFVGRVISSIQNIINTIRMVKVGITQMNNNIKNAMQLSVLALQPGSFNIKIAAKKPDGKLFEDKTTIQYDTISEFLSILKAKDIPGELEHQLINLNPEIIKKYKTLLQALAKSNANTTFSWASPKLSEEKNVVFSKDEIYEIIHTLKTYRYEYSKMFTVIGRLNILDLKNRKFAIITDKHPYRYSGFFLKDFDSSIENATMNRKYNIYIQKATKINNSTNKIIETKHILNMLEQH